MHLATAESFYSAAPGARPDRPAEWAPADLGVPLPTETAPRSEAEAFARADHGRWVVDCPWCPSAQVASATDHRFLCVDCHNAAIGGRWVAVTWPASRPAIERILAARPVENASWQPGETVANLRRENVDHGLPAELTADELARAPVPYLRAGQPPAAPPATVTEHVVSPDVGPVVWPPSAASAAGLVGMARPGRL